MYGILYTLQTCYWNALFLGYWILILLIKRLVVTTSGILRGLYVNIIFLEYEIT